MSRRNPDDETMKLPPDTAKAIAVPGAAHMRRVMAGVARSLAIDEHLRGGAPSSRRAAAEAHAEVLGRVSSALATPAPVRTAADDDPDRGGGVDVD